MKEITIDKTIRGQILKRALKITVLALLMLVSIAGAAPYAYITNTLSSNVTVIDTVTDKVINNVNVGNYPQGVAVNPKGNIVYVACGLNFNISEIDTATNKVIGNVGFNPGLSPYGVAFNPAGTIVYVAIDTVGGYIVVVNATTSKITATVPVGDHPMGVVVSPDGKRVYVTKYGNGNVSVIDAATNKVIMPSVGGLLAPVGIAIGPDGKKVYVANAGSDYVSVIDTATNNITANVTVGSGPWGVAITPDGKKVYVTNLGGYTVSVIDTATNRVTATIRVGNGPLGVSITSDGRKAYVANHRDNTVSVIDIATNAVTATVNVGSLPSAFGQFICTPPTQTTPPIANFSSNIRFGSAPLSVQFTDFSNNAASLSWNFGDGSTSTDKNPMHTYNKTGQFTVALTAKNTAGSNVLTRSKYITVVDSFDSPVTAFSASPLSGKVPLNVIFTDQSIGNITGWKWTFGDGNSSIIQNPTFTYNKAGKYTVTLTTSNAAGSNALTKTSYISVTS